MAHIHTLPGQIDGTADAFIVDTETKTVLLRMHEKYNMWIHVGGHIELDETPEQAVLREVKEEVGLEIALWRDYAHDETFPRGYSQTPVLPPYHMNIHDVDETHRHLSYIYYAKAITKDIVESENEKSGGVKWWTKEELENTKEVRPETVWYALDALSKVTQ